MTEQLPTQVEQAIIDEILHRKWATKQQIKATKEAISQKRLKGPLHKALFEQRILKHNQAETLEEFLHKDLTIGDFSVDRKLGSGAMGEVFLGENQEGQKAAIKIISRRFADDENFVRRFDREIESISKLEHPSIARAVDYGRHNGLPFLAMEFIQGPSLAQLMDKHGALPHTYAVNVIRQVAEGLAYVYAKTQLVHRDIKPENILVVPDNEARKDSLFNRNDRAVLIDFGLARSFSEDERLTMTGVTMGTPHYMSPEQIRGSQHLDARSDIYALGATLFHLLTGKTPYSGTSPGAVMTAHLTEDVPDPKQFVPGLDDQVRHLVMLCMRKEADERYANFEALSQACEAIAGSSGGGGGGDMQLLRKPLVLNKPTTKANSDKTPKSNTPLSNTPLSNTPLKNPVSTAVATDDAVVDAETSDEDESVSLPSLLNLQPPEEEKTEEEQLEEINDEDPRARMLKKADVIKKSSSAKRQKVVVEDEQGIPAASGEGSGARLATDNPTAADISSAAHEALATDFGFENESNPGYSGTEALRQLQSDRVKQNTSGPFKHNRKGRSVVHSRTSGDAKGIPAIGMMPLVILIGSVAILACLMIWSFFLR